MLTGDFYERTDSKGDCHRETGVRWNAVDSVPLRSGDASAETLATVAAATAAAANEFRQAASPGSFPTGFVRPTAEPPTPLVPAPAHRARHPTASRGACGATGSARRYSAAPVSAGSRSTRRMER